VDNARAFSQGGGQRWEPARRAHRASEGGFPRLSRARHFHGCGGHNPRSAYSRSRIRLVAGPVPMRLVHVGQQLHVGCRVAPGELRPLIHRRLHLTRFPMPGDQPRHLRPAQSGHPREVLPHHSLVRPAQASVLVPHQRPLHPGVNLGAPLPRKSNLPAPRQNARICSRLTVSVSSMLMINPQHPDPAPLQVRLV